MAATPVVWSLDALAERDEHYAYIAARATPTRAYAVLRKIMKSAERLAIFPESGRLLPSGHRELTVSRAPFVIEYELQEEVVHITHIWHTSQDRRGSRHQSDQ